MGRYGAVWYWRPVKNGRLDIGVNMALFGIVSKREHEALQVEMHMKQVTLQAELDAVKAQASNHYDNWLLRTAEAERYNMPDPSVYEYQADTYRKLSWVLQAVGLVASAAALTKFEVGRIVAGKEPKDIPNHEFEMLLSRPNP